MDQLTKAKLAVIWDFACPVLILAGIFAAFVACVSGVIYFWQYVYPVLLVIISVLFIIGLIMGVAKLSNRVGKYVSSEFKKAVQKKLEQMNDPIFQAQQVWDRDFEKVKKEKRKSLGRDLNNIEMIDLHSNFRPWPRHS